MKFATLTKQNVSSNIPSTTMWITSANNSLFRFWKGKDIKNALLYEVHFLFFFQFSLPILKTIRRSGARNFGLLTTTIFIKTPPSSNLKFIYPACCKKNEHCRNEKRKKSYKKPNEKSGRKNSRRVLNKGFFSFHKTAPFACFVCYSM